MHNDNVWRCLPGRLAHSVTLMRLNKTSLLLSGGLDNRFSPPFFFFFQLAGFINGDVIDSFCFSLSGWRGHGSSLPDRRKRCRHAASFVGVFQTEKMKRTWRQWVPVNGRAKFKAKRIKTLCFFSISHLTQSSALACSEFVCRGGLMLSLPPPELCLSFGRDALGDSTCGSPAHPLPSASAPPVPHQPLRGLYLQHRK